MAKLRGARRFAGPVAAGVVCRIFVGRAVCLRACQHIVLVGCVASTGDGASLFSEPGNFPRLLPRRASSSVSPCKSARLLAIFSPWRYTRDVSDAISRVDGVRALRADISVESLRASRCGRERLANLSAPARPPRLAPWPEPAL